MISPSSGPFALIGGKSKRSERVLAAAFGSGAAFELFFLLFCLVAITSNRRFKMRSSFAAGSNKFSPINLFTKEDIPVSNCSSGSVIEPEACRVRKLEKAARAHSIVARQPVEATNRLGDRDGFTGEVETLFRDRGCRGVIGTEFDLRRPFRGLAGSGFVGAFGACDVLFFTASPRAFSVALIT